MIENRNFSDLATKLRSLCVFRGLLSDEVIAALLKFLDTLGSARVSEKVDAYSAFVSALYGAKALSLAEYVRNIVFNSENIYVVSIGSGKTVSDILESSVREELEILREAAELSPDSLKEVIGWSGYLPAFQAEKTDLASEYFCRTASIGKYGYGIYAKYHMFRIDGSGSVIPVLNPDETRLSELIDYRHEQQIILDNTRALLDGKPAANILLTGDAGTGKSSTVKAVVNELYRDGLRIIEVKKEQLHEISAVLDALSENPLKFILFIDDLSFQKDDDNFSALKAVLEGSVSAKSRNVVVYATSNRRHLVKEKFSDREGDDVHFNDTMQEIISLSERFGIQITFNRPDKKTYLDIVHHLADSKGIKYDSDELDNAAERFALGRGTRSARAAKQFVDSLV